MLLIVMVCWRNQMHHFSRCALKTMEEGGASTLRLGVADGRLRAKIRYRLDRSQHVGLRLFNCNAVRGLRP